MTATKEIIIDIINFTRFAQITTDLPSRIRKAGEELGELAEAVANGDSDRIIEEAADLAIVAFHVMIILGANPTASMLINLDRLNELYPFKDNKKYS